MAAFDASPCRSQGDKRGGPKTAEGDVEDAPNVTRIFMTGTSTEVGKTTVGVGLLHCWRRQGHGVSALKPVESGVDGIALDARALADATGDADETASDWVRIAEPVSPHTAALLSGKPAVTAPDLACRVRAWSDRTQGTRRLVEGAGGFCVPLNSNETFADFAEALGWPIVLVGLDRLGVQSDVLAVAEVIATRGLTLASVVLNVAEAAPQLHNQAVLQAHLDCDVVLFNPTDLTSSALAVAAQPLAESLTRLP